MKLKTIIVGMALLSTLASSLVAQESVPMQPGTKAGDLWDGNALGIKFRWCPPGSFRMGGPPSEDFHHKDEAQVDVTLTKGFWMGQHEVTQGEWEQVMGPTVWKRTPFDKAGPNYAATNICWEDAVEFCQQLTAREHADGKLPKSLEYSLPTEAQWEYACRAGTTTPFSFGDDEAKLSEYAWYGGRYGDGNAKEERCVHEVGKFKPNTWGLHDMHGNVFEWCRDWYAEKLPGGTDPEVRAEATYRVYRGGSWYWHGKFSSSSFRVWSTSGHRFVDTGFRLTVQSR